MNIRLAKSWAVLNKMNAIWKSRLPDKIKRNFFRANVESVLVYGSLSWTLTKALEKKTKWKLYSHVTGNTKQILEEPSYQYRNICKYTGYVHVDTTAKTSFLWTLLEK